MVHRRRPGRGGQITGVRIRRRPRSASTLRSTPFCWLPLSLRYCRPRGPLVPALRLSYRYVEQLLGERGVEVDHVTIDRWVLRFTPLVTQAARPAASKVGDRWQVDDTLDEGRRAVALPLPGDRPAQTGHRCASLRTPVHARRLTVFPAGDPRNQHHACRFTTEQAPVYRRCWRSWRQPVWHRTGRYSNNRVEGDHDQATVRLRPMRGVKQDRSARVREGPSGCGYARFAHELRNQPTARELSYGLAVAYAPES